MAVKVNVGDVWKEMSAMKINIGDTWKNVIGGWINIGDSWKRFIGTDPLVARILVVGSGGGGGRGLYSPYTMDRTKGGGGGGGQVLYNSGTILTSTGYTITIGASQSGGLSSTRSNSSSFGSLISALGGMSGNIGNGGSSGSGNAGSPNSTSGSKCSDQTAGGGGGDAAATSTIKGGNGTAYDISGVSVYYAGGGKGGFVSDPGNSLGYDGYGAGGNGSNVCGPGGGPSIGGVVIVRYTSATQKATGGTVTQVGGDWVHTFTTSGNFVVS